LRGEDDATVFYVGVERVTGADIEATAERAGKNNLAFGGDFGLHGKTILPYFRSNDGV
jgi:hypothetical protein